MHWFLAEQSKLCGSLLLSLALSPCSVSLSSLSSLSPLSSLFSLSASLPGSLFCLLSCLLALNAWGKTMRGLSMESEWVLDANLTGYDYVCSTRSVPRGSKNGTYRYLSVHAQTSSQLIGIRYLSVSSE